MLNTSYLEDFRIASSSILRQYIHGGKGIVTLVAPSGKSHSYSFSKPINQDIFPDDTIFVYAVHEDKLFYVGMVENFQFRVTHNSRFNSDTEIARGAKYIVDLSNNPIMLLKTPMKVYHNGRCAKCRRTLSDAKSINLGFGTKCYKKFKPGYDEMSKGIKYGLE